jgi:hypothetical protein
MTTEEILEHITSRDTHKVWESACEIINAGQDRTLIAPLIRYLPEIKSSTAGLDMGGAFAPNQRFIDFAITTIEFHQVNESCPCALFIKKYKLTNDVVKMEIQYEGFDPNKEAKKGNIKIVDTAYIDNNWVDYYMVECAKCATHYKVEEREGHFMFWRWLKI